jgi:hypothetical protein
MGTIVVECHNQNLMKGFGAALELLGVTGIRRLGTALVYESPNQDNATYTLSATKGLKFKHTGVEL